ncbi:MAG: hypothetical protein EPO65_02715 [Dehalococcoidia bacterium]|nr:MAG: hypothetical protein EPO65_02715 [Dehalococcoidia bacterium]
MSTRPETDEPPFVGRETELGVLLAASTLVATRRGRSVLVYGEAGAGKSRMVNQFASRLRDQGWLVLSATLDAEDEHPHSLREQLLRALGEPVPVRRDQNTGILATEFTTSDKAALSLGAASRADAEHLVERLARSAADQPIALVVDEIRSLSAHDRWLLSLLAERSTESRLLPVFIARDEDLEPGSDLHRFVSLVTQRGLLLRLRIGALPLSDIGTYLRLRLGGRDGDETAVQVHARTDGNAFFVQELTSWLASDPSGRPLDEILNGLPDPIRDVIEFRLRTLSETTQHALLIAAVIGRRFDARVVASAADMSLGTAVGHLDTGVQHRMLISGDRTGTYVFAHALTRDTLLARLLPSRRAAIHGRIADAMGQIFGPLAPSYLPSRAGHLATAAGGEPERVREALDALRGAAAVHEARADWDAALSSCRLFLDLAEQAGTDVPLSVSAQVCLTGGRAALLAGQTRIAWQLLRRGVALARDDDDHALACEILLLALESIDLPVSRSKALAREALAISDPTSPATRVRLLLQVAGPEQSPESRAITDEARQMVDAHDLRDLKDLIEGRRYAELLHVGDLHAAEALAREEQVRQAGLGNTQNEARALARLAEILLRVGRLSEAQSIAERALEVAPNGRALAAATRARSVLMAVAVARGDTTGVESMARALGDYPLMYQLRARGLELSGDVDRAIEVMESEPPATRRHPRVAWDYHGTLARLFAQVGRDVDARSHLYSWSHRRADALHPGDRLDSPAVIAEGLEHAPDSLVREVLEESVARDQARFSLTNAASLDYARGLLALRLGQPAAAQRYARRAVEWARREGLAAEEARAQILIARSEELGVSSAPAVASLARPTSLETLSEREMEVLRLVASGRTNRQIAQHLAISHHTVARHVSHILTKTGAANRTEAAHAASMSGMVEAPREANSKI